jgi:hypothetical protein
LYDVTHLSRSTAGRAPSNYPVSCFVERSTRTSTLCRTGNALPTHGDLMGGGVMLDHHIARGSVMKMAIRKK